MKELRTQIRLPAELAEKLKQASEHNRRSFNSEMLLRLEQSFETDPEQLTRIEDMLKQLQSNRS